MVTPSIVVEIALMLCFPALVESNKKSTLLFYLFLSHPPPKSKPEK